MYFGEESHHDRCRRGSMILWEYLHEMESMSLDWWRMVESCDGDDPVKDAVA